MRIASAYYPDSYFDHPADPIIDPDDLDHDLLILWGGEDISPALYGEPVVASHAGDKPSRRDLVELSLAKKAVEEGIPILGICRGHQLLGALNGNKLFQHVDNHIGNHAIIYKGQVLRTNSCHHQMVIPNDDMEVVAYVPCMSRIKVTRKKIIDEADECEVAYFPKLKAIGVQGHPEWLPRDSDLTKLTVQLLKEKLNVDL